MLRQFSGASRRLPRAATAVLMWVALMGLAAFTAAAQSPAEISAALEPIRTALDVIEQAVREERQSDQSYAELRGRLTPLRDDLRAKIEAVEPQLADIETRLKQLGEPPAAGAPPEAPEIASERQRLTRERADLEAALKQARLLALRADQISNQINERRRALFTKGLFARSAGLFDPVFWRDARMAVGRQINTVEVLARWWWDFGRNSGGWSGLASAAAMLMALAAAALLLHRWWYRRLLTRPVSSRFDKAFVGLAVALGNTLRMPVAVWAIGLVLQNSGLMPPSIAALWSGLTAAVAVASFGRAAAIALLAPGEAGRRLIALREDEAATFSSHLAWGARLLGLAIFLNIFHKETSAPLALTVATSALLSLAVGFLAAHLLVRFPRPLAEGEQESYPRWPWLRAVLWVFVAVIAVALVSGYIGFAAFLAGRFLAVLAMLCALAIALAFVDALFSDVLITETATGRAVAAMFGVTPRTLELAGTLLSGALRILLVLAAVIPVLGPWGIIVADLFGALQEAALGVRIGEVTISLASVLIAFVWLVGGVLAARGAQRWMEMRFMPRTGLDPGLQHSVSRLFGYALLIAAISLALAQLGIDLQKIALVAGALSVGIGFGLQSVVSNFVSGLILLAERPIRVGDWVVVKNEEGYVRRISVRATEIETFDRASVIVPNSELITGVLKNWTRANLMGRVTVKVGVAYDSDVEKVRDLLLSCANDHPQVLCEPPPRVFLVAFGDSALEFELRCIVANVENALSVKSDLNFEVIRRFRAAGIVIPFPQREIRVIPDDGKSAAAHKNS